MGLRTFEPGCYGDGAMGHQHTRERASEILRDALIAFLERSVPGFSTDEVLATIDALRGEMSDDAAEESEATEWLDKLTEASRPAGYWWGWWDGDFGLWDAQDE